MRRLVRRFAVTVATLAAVVAALVVVPGPTAAAATVCDSPTCTLSISGGTICWQPSPCMIPITISQPAPPDGVRIGFRTLDGSARAGVDYVQVVRGMVTIPAGARSGMAVVQTIRDQVLEPSEHFYAVLTSTSHGHIANGQAMVTIR